MEKKVDKISDRSADALNRNVNQQARHVPSEVPSEDGIKRRTWEGYAEDYRVLSEELVDVSRRQQDAIAQIKTLEAQLGAKEADLERIKNQRLKDLDRLAAVSRTRDLLEKRAAAQMAKVAAALARPGGPAANAVGHGDVPGQQLGISFAERFEDRPALSLGWIDRKWQQRTIRAAQEAQKERRLADAQLLFEAALLTKQSPSLWEQLGHVLREAGQFLDAETAYRRALRAKPDDGEMLFLSGYCLEMAGSASGAIPLYEAALAADPRLTERYDHLRNFRERLGH